MGIVVAFDQWTKHIIINKMVLYQSINILPFFNFTLLHNRGAAFSFLNNENGWQVWFLALIALAIIVTIVAYIVIKTRQSAWQLTALTLILAGAIGNVWDRIQLGYVIDFFDFFYKTWHWPPFNIADSAICVGVIILLFKT